MHETKVQDAHKGPQVDIKKRFVFVEKARIVHGSKQ